MHTINVTYRSYEFTMSHSLQMTLLIKKYQRNNNHQRSFNQFFDGLSKLLIII